MVATTAMEAAAAEDPLEGPLELSVRRGVDDRIANRIEVAEPEDELEKEFGDFAVRTKGFWKKKRRKWEICEQSRTEERAEEERWKETIEGKTKWREWRVKREECKFCDWALWKG